MEESFSNNGFGDGVYFEKQDYASFSRRFIATLIDAAVISIASVILWQIIVYLPWASEWSDDNYESTERTFWITCCVSVWMYLTVCKASFRTIGYRVTGLRIITLRGQKVPWYQMTFRLLMWIFGPFNFLLDACWIFADDARQSCRDCYSGTLLVKNHAIAAGQSPIHLARYGAAGLNLVYQRAIHPKEQVVTGSGADQKR